MFSKSGEGFKITLRRCFLTLFSLKGVKHKVRLLPTTIILLTDPRVESRSVFLKVSLGFPVSQSSEEPFWEETEELRLFRRSQWSDCVQAVKLFSSSPLRRMLNLDGCCHRSRAAFDSPNGGRWAQREGYIFALHHHMKSCQRPHTDFTLT